MTTPSAERAPTKRRRVQLFVTCLIEHFRPEVATAAARVLERLGVEVSVPAAQTCCGQPAYNSGHRAAARETAAHFLDAFADDVDIVVPSGSCASMVRHHYGRLFADDPPRLARAEAISQRVYELTEYLVDVLGRTDLGAEFAATATYHPCCHLTRDLGVDRQPKALLDAVEGLQMLPLERADVCCGFGGGFSMQLSEVSGAMLDEKLDHVVATGAQVLVAADTGCILHMAGGARRRKLDLAVMHIAELLDAPGKATRDDLTTGDPAPADPATGTAATCSPAGPRQGDTR